MSPGIRYGFLGGIVVVFYFTLLYVAKQDLFLSPLIQWGIMAAYLFFMWKASQEDCAAHGKNRDFREVVRTPFLVFLIINLCYWLFYYGLHLYDPSLLQAEMSLELDMLRKQLADGLGDPQQANSFRERVQELEKTLAAPQPQPLGPVLTRMCVGAVGGFALASGVTALIKRQ
ncbi:MAG TPA: DUF4199 family protein [Saprospiraceae bacterium]|nr:DUF4199 family protein [Saprospiraceae bacterium]